MFLEEMCVCYIVRPKSRKMNVFNHLDNQTISLNIQCLVPLKKDYFLKPLNDYWQKYKRNGKHFDLHQHEVRLESSSK